MFDANRAYLTQFSNALCRRLGWLATATSFYRNDYTAHRRGVALDVAFRTGPLMQQLASNDINYYLTPGLADALTLAVADIEDDWPNITRVVIESDHLHVEMSPRGRLPHQGIQVLIFAPPRYTSITQFPGIPSPLRYYRK